MNRLTSIVVMAIRDFVATPAGDGMTLRPVKPCAPLPDPGGRPITGHSRSRPLDILQA
jgi:hypothetical protein